MTRAPGLLRRAFSVLSLRLVLEQISLALVVFALFALWLRIPDASAMDVLGSVLLGLIVLAAAGMGEASLMLRLCGGLPVTRGRFQVRVIRGAVILLGAGALAAAWWVLVAHVEVKNGLRAGYLNSRFPHSLRNVFSYGHIQRWLGWMGAALRWLGAGVLTLLAFALVTSSRPARSAKRGLGSGAYWVTLLVGAAVVSPATNSLLHWTPLHGLRLEMLSLVARLGLALLLNGIFVSLLLTILAACVRDTDPTYAASDGTPDESQPLTAERP